MRQENQVKVSLIDSEGTEIYTAIADDADHAIRKCLAIRDERRDLIQWSLEINEINEGK